MVDNACPFVAFQAIQKFFNTISSCKLRKSSGFDLLCVQSLPAIRRLTLVAAFHTSINSASTNLTPFSILAPGQFLESIAITALTGNIL